MGLSGRVRFEGTSAGLAIAVALSIAPFVCGQTPGEIDPQEVQSLIAVGLQAKATGDTPTARKKLREAVALSENLPDWDWLTRAESLKHLAYLLTSPQEGEEAESLFRERVDIVRKSAPKDPELGQALFELQSALAAHKKLAEALATAEEASKYYRDDCPQSLDPKRCDRKLADVEGLMGAAYFNAERYDEARPFLKKVTDRPDEGVRPEIMLAALRAHTVILYKSLALASAASMHIRTIAFEKANPRAVRSLGERTSEPPL